VRATDLPTMDRSLAVQGGIEPGTVQSLDDRAFDLVQFEVKRTPSPLLYVGAEDELRLFFVRHRYRVERIQ
jgi:hypothetical protein